MLAALALRQLRSRALESGQRLTESFSHVIEEQTALTLQTANQRLQLAAGALAEAAASGRLTEKSAQLLLREQIREAPFLRAMWVIDARGRTIYDSDAGNIGRYFGDRAYFQIFLTEPTTTFYLGAPVRSRTTGTWLISAARPLRPVNGVFAGIIVAAIDPSYLDRLWHKVDLGPDGSIGLFRNDGVLMMRSPFDDSVMGKNFSHRPWFKTMLPKAPAGSFQDASPIDGILRLFAYRTLSTQPSLIVVVGQSHDALLAPWRRLSMVAIGIWATASAAIVVLCLLLDRAWRQGLRSEVLGQHMAERLALATNATSLAVWDWDVTTGRMFASPSYFTMMGYDPDEVLTSHEQWLDRVHPADRTSVAGKIQSALTGTEATYRYEARLLHADGSFRWVNAIGSVLGRDSRGRATRLMGVREDITERKRADEALRDSEQRFRTIFEAEPECVKVLGKDGALLEMNAAGLAMLEAGSVEEAKSQTLVEYLRPEDRAAFAALFRSVLAGEAGQLQYEITGLRGTRRWLETHAAPMRDAEGRPLMMLAITRDVTQRRQGDEALRKSLAEKGALLKEVHHRVKNNLQVVTSLLRLETSRNQHLPTRSVLKAMQNRIHSMALLHETLYRTGMFAAVDLGVYLRQLATQSFRALNDRPGPIELDLDLASVQVEMDQAIPCGLLVNELISNCLKHGFPDDHGGRIRVELVLVDGGPQLVLRVSDTGKGLPTDFAARPRNSLGLQLVADLAKQLRGTLEVGPEATFTVAFTPAPGEGGRDPSL